MSNQSNSIANIKFLAGAVTADKLATSIETEISCGNLVSLIYILSDAACKYFGIEFDEWHELPLGRFTEFLESMPKNVKVRLIVESKGSYNNTF